VCALENRVFAVFVAHNIFVDVFAANRIHAGGRFVEEQQFGVADTRDSLVELALVAPR